MLEIPFNSVRRWQLVVVKCLASSHSAEQRLSQYGQFLGDSPKCGQKQTKEQQQKEIGIQNKEEDADFAVMIKGAPEVILRWFILTWILKAK